MPVATQGEGMQGLGGGVLTRHPVQGDCALGRGVRDTPGLIAHHGSLTHPPDTQLGTRVHFAQGHTIIEDMSTCTVGGT